MDKLQKLIKSSKIRYLSPADFVNIAFLVILSLLELISAPKVPYWYLIILLNILLVFFIIYFVSRYEKNVVNEFNTLEKFSIIKIFRYWYGVIFILIFFKQVYLLIHFLSPADCDVVLIQLDYKLFGLNPTQWAFRFQNAYLTEFLQVIYFFYYVMIIIYGLELYLWKRYKEFLYAIFIIFTGFYLSYILYMIFPAAGPRFYLHNFYSIKAELPGIFLTDYIRAFLNFGESIPSNVTNPEAYVQRDAMPSAHASLALIIAYLSWKIKSKSFYFYLPYFVLMVISTIYLRYHYVVDIFAGILLAVFTIIIGEYLLKHSKPGKWGKIRGIM